MSFCCCLAAATCSSAKTTCLTCSKRDTSFANNSRASSSALSASSAFCACTDACSASALSTCFSKALRVFVSFSWFVVKPESFLARSILSLYDLLKFFTCPAISLLDLTARSAKAASAAPRFLKAPANPSRAALAWAPSLLIIFN